VALLLLLSGTIMVCMQVSNAAGYLCHIQLQCRLDVSPEVVFEIFSHPDNAGAFRDIKKVGYRKVGSTRRHAGVTDGWQQY
jgi:hypothetical protein